MRLLFWIALKLRLSQKFWGEWFLRWHRKRIQRIIDNIDIDISDIKLVSASQGEVSETEKPLF